MVLVADPRLGEQRLEPLGVGPRVLRPTHAAALADVEDLGDAGLVKHADEARGVELVDANRRDPGHGPPHPATTLCIGHRDVV